jgi:putative peptidoglycan binding protein
VRPSDPDDWFTDESAAADQDWLDQEDGAPSRARPPVVGLTPRNAFVGGAILLVAIVAGLWIGGAFSGSKSHATGSTSSVTTTRTPTTTVPKRHVLAAPATVLSPGAHGVQVGVLQRALKQLGYSPGTIDGAYGPSTQAALMKFQKASGLTADGVLGPKTLRALKQALQKQASG